MQEEEPLNPKDIVTLTSMKHLHEIQFMKKMNLTATIRKLNKFEYVVLETGEVREYSSSVDRSENINSLRKTFKKLRYLINNNFSGAPNELFVTLTYRGEEQTNDTKKVYKDFDNFKGRLQYKYKDKSSIDMIRVLEPHASGNWHMHVLMRFNDVRSIFIENSKLASLWGHGFVTIKALENVDNIGAYVSAYLADVELTDETMAVAFEDDTEVVEKEVNGEKKKFIKGGRLHFYPVHTKIYTKTKGIETPDRKSMTYSEAKKIVGSAEPHYNKTITVHGVDGFENTIRYEQYNSKRL